MTHSEEVSLLSPQFGNIAASEMLFRFGSYNTLNSMTKQRYG